MRIRVSQRILLLGIVLALLCALPAVTPSTSLAKPYNWDRDPDDPTNPGPKGDGDGTIVKARYIGGVTTDAAMTTTTKTKTATVTRLGTWSSWRTYLSLVRWGFGSRFGF